MITIKNRIINLLIIGFLIFITGCLTSNSDSDNVNPENLTLYVFGTDFSSGNLKWLAVEDSTFNSGTMVVNSDSKLRSYGKYLYVLERFGADNILKIDPTKTGDGAVVYQTHLGDFWNPNDIVFVNETKAYIALEGVPYILVFDPKEGVVLDSIITRDYIYTPGQNDSGYAATTPHATKMVIDGNFLYVSLQRRNGDWKHQGGTGLVLKINTEDNSIVESLSLRNRNPQAFIKSGSDLLISSIGTFGNLNDGAIEKLDFSNNTTKELITETDLAGNPVDFVRKSGDEYYVLSYVAWGDVGVKLVNLSTGDVVKTLDNITDAGSELYYDSVSKRLFVTEREPTAPGIKVFGDDDQLIIGPIKMDLPPSSFALVDLN